jgi:O-antigen/teichoic acid export membrane protein
MIRDDDRGSGEPLSISTAKGVRVTFAAVVLNGIVQFGVLVILARLLDPKDFGLIALAFAILRPVQLLVLSGIERAVVWTRDLKPGDVGGLLWLSIMAGAVLTAVYALSAGFVADITGTSELVAVLRETAPLFLIWAVGTTSRGLLARRHQFGRLVVIETASYVFGFATVAIAAAWHRWGVASLVLAYNVQAILITVLVVAAARPSWRWHGRTQPLTKSVAYGLSVSGLSFLEAAHAQIVPVVTGRMLGASALGLFTRAYSIAQLPVELLSTAIGRVIMSSFVAVGDDLDRLRRGVTSMLRISAAIVLPITFGSAAASQQLTDVLLGQKWAGAAVLILWLSFASAATVVGNLMAVLCEARAQLRQKLLILAATTIVLIAGLFGLSSYDLAGFAAAYMLSKLAYLLLYIGVTGGVARLGFTALLRVFWPGLCAGLVAAGAAFAVATALGPTSPFMVLPLQIAACGLSCLAAYALFFPALLREMWGLAGITFLLRRLAGRFVS